MSTIYLDKPMKNHTLMQTIARANRVFGEKNNGLIVDYVGVFRNLEKALAIYGSKSGGGVKDGECPIEKKEELVEDLRLANATNIRKERNMVDSNGRWPARNASSNDDDPAKDFPIRQAFTDCSGQTRPPTAKNRKAVAVISLG